MELGLFQVSVAQSSMRRKGEWERGGFPSPPPHEESTARVTV